MTMSIGKSVMRGLEKSMEEFGRELLERACERWGLEKHGFSVEEAMRLIVGVTSKGGKKVVKKVVKKEVVERASVPLPYVGVVDSSRCFGIKLNHGLHTQCETKCDEEWCDKCMKQAVKNASGKPNYGDIRDRKKCDLLEFRDAKGKKTMPYANVVKKMGLDMELCLREAEKFGVKIPEEHLKLAVSKRGRPKKSVSVADTKSSSGSKKSAKADDLLAALQSAAPIDTESVASKTSSRGRPRLSSEERAAKKAAADAEKAKKAEARAAKKAAAEAEKAKKAEARAAKKAAADAEKAKKAEERAAKKAAADAEKAKKAEERAAKKAAAEAEKAKKAEARAAKKAAAEAEKVKKAEERAAKKAAAEAEKAAAEAKKESVTEKAADADIPDEFKGCAAPELAAAEASSTEVVETAEEESEVQEEVVKVVEFEHEGVTYWKDGNTLYDPKTREVVGFWQPKTMEIVEPTMSDSEEEDSDDELSEEELSDSDEE